MIKNGKHVSEQCAPPNNDHPPRTPNCAVLLQYADYRTAHRHRNYVSRRAGVSYAHKERGNRLEGCPDRHRGSGHFISRARSQLSQHHDLSNIRGNRVLVHGSIATTFFSQPNSPYLCVHPQCESFGSDENGDEESFLSAQLSLSCSGAEHTFWRLYAAFFFAVYVRPAVAVCVWLSALLIVLLNSPLSRLGSRCFFSLRCTRIATKSRK